MVQQVVWVVTGASRGIGAAIVHKVLEHPDTVVVAGARQPETAQALQKLRTSFPSRLQIVQMDVTDQQSVQAAVDTVAKQGLRVDYLVNNAGINDSSSRARDESVDSLKQALDIHCIGAHRVTQAFLPLLQSGHKKTVINMSSVGGAFSWNEETMARPGQLAPLMQRCLGYKTSKAALNMLTLNWAADVTPAEGFTFVAIHPGTVLTDMVSNIMSAIQQKSQQEGLQTSSTPASDAADGSDLATESSKGADEAQEKPLTAEECAIQLVQTMLKLTPADSGKFLDNAGRTLLR